MKLAFCLFNYFPYGGLQRDFLRIAEVCFARGHQIDVYTMAWEGQPMPWMMHVNIIPIKAVQNHTRRHKFYQRIKSSLRQKNYDLVVGFNKMPGLDIYYAADTCYASKALTQRNFLYRLTSRYRQSKLFEKIIFDPASQTEILLLSAQQKVEYQQCYGTQDARFHLLPPGIDKSRIAPANAAQQRIQLRKKFDVEADEFLLLMVGSGFRTKGLDRIIQALAMMPMALKDKVKFFVIGKDNPISFIKQAKRLGVDQTMKFLGGRDDIPQLLLSADLLLHPAYNENTGTVLLEALCSGLPVLTTDVCGYAHHIKKANAGIVLSSPFNQDEFNKTLYNMLLSNCHDEWKKNGIHYATTEDLYSLPNHAVDFIESLHASAEMMS